MNEWRIVTQALSALDNSEPPGLSEFMVGATVQVLERDDAYVRFRWGPSSDQTFCSPKRSFDKVTAPKSKRSRG